MEWNYVIELAKEINLAQLVIIGLMFWFFYSRLEGKIEKNKQELKIEINENKQELKIDINRLSDKIDDVDRRLCRIEGSLATQGHCLFSQTQTKEKAQ